MKRMIAICIVLLMLLPLVGCAVPDTVTEGFYRSDVADYIWVSFEADGDFSGNYRDKTIAVVDLIGTYVIQDGKAVCTVGDATLIFKIVDEKTVRFIESGSVTPDDFGLKDGTKFILEEQT